MLCAEFRVAGVKKKVMSRAQAGFSLVGELEHN